jgi:hypothetical protein
MMQIRCGSEEGIALGCSGASHFRIYCAPTRWNALWNM